MKLKPLSLHILLALAAGDGHGYGLMQEIRKRSGGTVPVQTASFYRHLGKLMDEGFVAETSRRPADADPRRGTYYRITPRGLEILMAEKQRLSALVDQLNRIPRRATA